MKKLICAFLCLMLLLPSALADTPARRLTADEPLYTSLYERGMELAWLFNETVHNDEYLNLFLDPRAYEETLSLLRMQDFTDPLDVIIVRADCALAAESIGGLSVGGLARRLESADVSENMKEALIREEYHQTAWQLTWADAPEWDSHEYSLLYDLLAVKDAWIQPEEMDGPCFAVMFYGGLYALLITFVPNANRVVEARAQLIPSRAADELNIPIE